MSEEIKALTKTLVDSGKIIEAGYTGLVMVAFPKETSPQQISEMRSIFFAGAQHLFTSIMNVLETGAEPTANDLNRLSLIYDELEQFRKEFELRHFKAKGNA